MTLENFVKKVRSAGLVKQIYQKQVAEPEEQRRRLENAARSHPGMFTEEQIRRGEYLTPEGLVQLHESINLANRQMFRNDAKEYVERLDDKKLKDNAIVIKPVESADHTADKRHYSAHKRAYEISQSIAKAENGDTKSVKALKELEEEAVKHGIEEARAEVRSKLKTSDGKNYLGLSDEEVEEWINRVANIQEIMTRRALEQLREKDTLAPARYLLNEAQTGFYNTFADGDKDKTIANYVRANILALPNEGKDEEKLANMDMAIEYVTRLAA